MKQPLATTRLRALHCARRGAQPAVRSPQKPSRATPFSKKRGVRQVVADGREAYRKAHWTENSMPYVLSRGKLYVHPFPSAPMPYDMIHLNLKRSL